MADSVRLNVFFSLFALLSPMSIAEKVPTIAGVPPDLTWQNTPRAWRIDEGKMLTLSSGAKTDWFVDPFDGTVANSAPMLLFSTDLDYVFSTLVKVKFCDKVGRRSVDALG